MVVYLLARSEMAFARSKNAKQKELEGGKRIIG